MVSLRLMVIAKQWEKFVENLGCQKTADVPEPFRGFAQLPFFCWTSNMCDSGIQKLNRTKGYFVKETVLKHPETKDPPVMSSFFYQNGFVSVSDRDHCWMVAFMLCNAVASEMQIWWGFALLAKKKGIRTTAFGKASCNESMKVVLHARFAESKTEEMNPQRHCIGQTSLFRCKWNSTPKCEANADPSVQGLVPWHCCNRSGQGTIDLNCIWWEPIPTSYSLDVRRWITQNDFHPQPSARCDVNFDAFFPTLQAFQRILDLIFSIKHRLLGPINPICTIAALILVVRKKPPLMLSWLFNWPLFCCEKTSFWMPKMLGLETRFTLKPSRQRQKYQGWEDILLSELRVNSRGRSDSWARWSGVGLFLNFVFFRLTFLKMPRKAGR